MLEKYAGVSGYFDAIQQALKGLASVVETESGNKLKSGLLYNELSWQLSTLEHSFACWKLKCLFSDSFKIDRSESGFPSYKAVLELQRDAAQREAALVDIPEPQHIREQMIELLLKYKQFPDELQRMMARRDYFDTLGQAEVFAAFNSPHTLHHSISRKSGRPTYVVAWSTYDGTANMPIVYTLVVEDSSEDADEIPMKGPWDTDGDWLEEFHFKGLPNLQLRSAFREFAQNHSSYGLTLTTIATALDQNFSTLHPKQLRRFVLGPFYAGGLTDHNEKVQSVLNAATDPSENWLLTWTIQELHALKEISEPTGLWNSETVTQVFHVNTDDVDCAAQGVSALERYALVPHGAYQATTANGLAEDIFKDYRCYISSGEHILKYV